MRIELSTAAVAAIVLFISLPPTVFGVTTIDGGISVNEGIRLVAGRRWQSQSRLLRRDVEETEPLTKYDRERDEYEMTGGNLSSNISVIGMPWEVLSGECTVESNTGCLLSPGYPAEYKNNQACTVSTAGDNLVGAIRADEFEFAAESGDSLVINGLRFTGSGEGLAGLVPSGQIVWSSDSSSPDTGFRLCLGDPGIAANLGKATLEGLASKGQLWHVESGSCLKENGSSCIMSPHYPSNYPDGQTCKIKVDAEDVMITDQDFKFKTEATDALTINGKRYYDDGAGLVGVRPVGDILWSSDATVPQSGWRLCLSKAVVGDSTHSVVHSPYAIGDRTEIEGADVERISFQIDNLKYDELDQRGQDDVVKIILGSMSATLSMERSRFAIALRNGHGGPSVPITTEADVAITMPFSQSSPARKTAFEQEVAGPTWAQALMHVGGEIEKCKELNYKGAPGWPKTAIVGDIEVHSPFIWDTNIINASEVGDLPTAVPPSFPLPTAPPAQRFAHVSFVLESVPFEDLSEGGRAAINTAVIKRFAENFPWVVKNKSISHLTRSGSGGAGAFTRVDLMLPVPMGDSDEEAAQALGGTQGETVVGDIVVDAQSEPEVEKIKTGNIEVVAHVAEIVTPASTPSPVAGNSTDSVKTKFKQFHATFEMKNLLWPLMPKAMKEQLRDKAVKLFSQSLKVGRGRVMVQGSRSDGADAGTVIDVEVTPPPYVDINAMVESLRGSVGTKASAVFAREVARFPGISSSLLPGLAREDPLSVISVGALEVTLGAAPVRTVPFSFDFDTWGEVLVQGDLLMTFSTPICASGVSSGVLSHAIRATIANLAKVSLDGVSVLLQGLGSTITTASYLIRKVSPDMRPEPVISRIGAVELSTLSGEVNNDLRAHPTSMQGASGEECSVSATSFTALRHGALPQNQGSYAHPGVLGGGGDALPPGVEVHKTVPVSIAGNLLMNFTDKGLVQGQASLDQVRSVVRAKVADASHCPIDDIQVVLRNHSTTVFDAIYTIDVPAESKTTLLAELEKANLTATLETVYKELREKQLIT